MTIKKLVFVICRSLLVIGISYVILYPLVVKLSVSLMSAADLKDPMVKWFVKSPTFTNFSHAAEVIWQGFFEHIYINSNSYIIASIILYFSSLRICKA